MKPRATSWLIAACVCAFLAPDLVQAQEPAVSSDWLTLKHDGDAALGSNVYGKAERDLNSALALAEKFKSPDIRLAQTLESLGQLQATRGNFSKAGTLYERALRVSEQALGSEHPQVVAQVGKLAQFYINHGPYEKSERLSLLLIAFADRRIKEQQALKGEFGKIDHFYDKSTDYLQAKGILTKLEDETNRTTTNENMDLATTLDALGHAYQAASKWAQAERLYKCALSFRQDALKGNHLALAYSYENLGNLMAAQGKSSEAEPYLQKSLEMTQSLLQPGRPEVFKRLDELAQSHISMGQMAEAESLYKRALTLMDQSNDHADAGKCCLCLADLYIKQGRYSAAEPLMKRALVAIEKSNGPQHAAVADVLDTYAQVLEKLSKNGEAAKMRARARSIRGGGSIEKADAGSQF